MWLVALFAGMATLLAVAGIYAVIAFLVALRTREFGIRLAVGSQPRELLMGVVRDGVIMGLAGIVAGALCGFALVRLATSYFPGVRTPGALPLAGSAIILLAASVIASLLPAMRARPRADIVMVSSAITGYAPPNSAPYTMAKAALEMAARTLAREERRHGIRVNVVAPGLVATDMGERLVRAVAGRALHDLDSASPFGRVCLPEDVASVVAFLVSADCGYVTGQRLVIDGGGPDLGIV